MTTTNPMDAFREAEHLRAAGRHPQALEKYLWCLDEGEKADSAFSGVRHSHVLEALQQLAKVYPPAATALRVRRDTLEAALLAQTRNPTGAVIEVYLLARLNEALGEPSRNFELYRHLRRGGVAAEAHRRLLFERARPLLLEQRRYSDLVLEDERLRTDFGRSKYATSECIDQAFTRGVQYFEVLLGTRRTDEAFAVADELLRLDSSDAAFARLVRHAVRAGDNGSAQKLYERGVSQLPEGHRTELERAWRSIGRAE